MEEALETIQVLEIIFKLRKEKLEVADQNIRENA
jgi:hypothetical protein